jgi:hypothetical protein
VAERTRKYRKVSCLLRSCRIASCCSWCEKASEHKRVNANVIRVGIRIRGQILLAVFRCTFPVGGTLGKIPCPASPFHHGHLVSYNPALKKPLSLTHIRSILQGGYQHPLSRSWQSRRTLTKSMFMYPIFITDDPEASVPIPSLPGQRRWGVNKLREFLEPLVEKGLQSVILFGVPLHCVKVSLNHISKDIVK